METGAAFRKELLVSMGIALTVYLFVSSFFARQAKKNSR
jgi:hypothetical protein